MPESIAASPNTGVPGRTTLSTFAAAFLAVAFAQTALVVSSPLNGLIQTTLHTSGTQLSWVSDAFLLPTVVLELTFGVLGDLFGRKRLLVIGSFVTALGDAITALTHNIGAMLVGQALAGIGAAAVFPTSLAVIVAATPTARSRARGLVVWTMGMSVGASVGPVVGGAIGLHGSYQWAFGFVAIGSVIAGLACLLGSADSRAAQGRRLDWGGQATIVVALVAILYAIIQAPDAGWSSAQTIICLAVGAVFLAIFVLIELRTPEPLLDLRLLAIPAFTGAALVALIALCGFLGMVYSISIRMAVIQGQDSLRVGLYTLILNILPFAILPFFSRSLVKFDVRAVLGTGLLALAAGQFWLSQIPITNTGLGALTLPLMLCGFGFVTIIASVSGAAVNSVELRQAGMASGAINMVRDLGQTLGIAIASAIAISAAAAALPGRLAASGLPPAALAVVNHVAAAGGPIAVAHANLGPISAKSIPAAQDALWHGFSTALVVCGTLSLIAFVITLALVRHSRQPAQETAIAELAIQD
jgi:MFS family permease